MKHTLNSHSSRRPTGSRRFARHLAVLSCSVASSAMSQSVFAPLPTIPGESVPPTAPNAVTAGITTGAAADTEKAPLGPVAALPGTATAEFLTWGQMHVRTHVSYQLLYATGVQSSPGQASDTITHTLNPGVAIGIGSRWMLDYEPSFQFFSDSHFHDTVNQSVSLAGGTSYGNWTFGLSQSYNRSDDPSVETGGQTALQSYNAGLSAGYHFNDKWSLETSGGASLVFVGQNAVQTRSNGLGGLPPTNSLPLSDSQSYFGSEWANYQLDTRLGLALGISGGYSHQDGGLETANEQYLGRVIFAPGSKLALTLDGGLEDQQFLNSNQSDLWTPIFASSISYHLFEPTTFILSASRSVEVSLFQGQVTRQTTLGLGLQQQLIEHLVLSLNYSHSIADYISAVPNGQRSDTGNSYYVGLSLGLLKHGSIGTFYEYSQNSSSTSGFSYSSHQAGLSLTWAY